MEMQWNARKCEEIRGNEKERVEKSEGGGAATNEKSHSMRRDSTRWPRLVGRIDGVH